MTPRTRSRTCVHGRIFEMWKPMTRRTNIRNVRCCTRYFHPDDVDEYGSIIGNRSSLWVLFCVAPEGKDALGDSVYTWGGYYTIGKWYVSINFDGGYHEKDLGPFDSRDVARIVGKLEAAAYYRSTKDE